MRISTATLLLTLLSSGCAGRYSSDTKWPVESATGDAERDLGAGVFKIIYGGMPWRTYWAEREILEREYQIELITTCDAGYIHYGNRYTTISLPAIQQRFGTNLLTDVRRRAEAGIEATTKETR